MAVCCVRCAKDYADGMACCPFCNTANPELEPRAGGKAPGTVPPDLDRAARKKLAALAAGDAPLAPPDPPRPLPPAIAKWVARFAVPPAERARLLLFALAALDALLALGLLVAGLFPSRGLGWLPGLGQLLAAAALAGAAHTARRAGLRPLWAGCAVAIADLAVSLPQLGFFATLLKLLLVAALCKFAIEATVRAKLAGEEALPPPAAPG